MIATGIGGFSEIANAVHTTDERGPRRLSPFSDPLHGFDPLATIPAKERKKMDRFIEFALVAAREALAQAGWSPASAA
ncbi:beta-ketoacyl-ACP synthase II, partial [Klebsiella pneumoniae]